VNRVECLLGVELRKVAREEATAEVLEVTWTSLLAHLLNEILLKSFKVLASKVTLIELSLATA
jgi:hypothetical protein